MTRPADARTDKLSPEARSALAEVYAFLRAIGQRKGASALPAEAPEATPRVMEDLPCTVYRDTSLTAKPPSPRRSAPTASKPTGAGGGCRSARDGGGGPRGG
jgi:hypothetical protein